MAAKSKTPAKKTPPKKAPAKKAPTKKVSPKKKPPASKERTGYVKSESELADFLRCARSTISRLKRKPGCPEKTADGKYPMSEWKEFYEKEKGNHSVDDAELAGERKAKRELSEVKLELEKIELEKARGEVENVETICRILTQAFAGAVQHLKDAEHVIGPLVSGLDVPDAKKLIRKSHIEAMEKFSLGEWAKKKPFWAKVYAHLQDLQATLNRGSGLSET